LNYIILDIEATCWKTPPPDPRFEIIELGAYKLDQFGEVRGKFTRFVKPMLNPTLSDFCRQLTTIEQVDVNRAKTYPYIIEEFLEWSHIDQDNEDFLLCSWGNFDKKILADNCKLHDLDSWWTAEHANLKDLYMKMNRWRQPIGLRKAVEREGFEFTGTPHRAISDAENLAKIFVKFMSDWKY
jgi:3'-5' exoribonuclease 1